MTRLKLLVFALVALGVAGYQVVLFETSLIPSAAERASTASAGAAAEVGLRVEARRSALQLAALALVRSSVTTLPTPTVVPTTKQATAVRAPEVRVEIATEERLAAARQLAVEALGGSFKGDLVVLVSSDTQTLVSIGGAAGIAPPPELDVAAAVGAESSGVLLAVAGVPHFFVSAPVLTADRAEPKAAGWVAVGVPLLGDVRALAGELARGAGGASIAIVFGKAVIASSGEAASLPKAADVAPGTAATTLAGPLERLGPLALPLLHPGVAIEAAAHRSLAGTPLGVVAVASVRGPLEALARAEKFSLFGLVGLGLLLVAVLLISGSDADADEGPAMVVPPPVPIPPLRDRVRSTSSRPAVASAAPASASASGAVEASGPVSAGDEALVPPHADAHVAPELSPDDFEFPSGPAAVPAARPAADAGPPDDGPPDDASEPETPTRLAPAAGRMPDDAFLSQPVLPNVAAAPPADAAEDPFAGMADAGAPPARVTSQRPPLQLAVEGDDQEGQTRAYPVFRGPGAAPAGGRAAEAWRVDAGPAATAAEDQEDAPLRGEVTEVGESTRVASVPQELIRRTRASSPGAERPGQRAPSVTQPLAPPAGSASASASAPAPPPPPAASPSRSSSPSGVATDEERHFQEVYREFLATRERCGEPSDGLTFEKFKAKLLKNKEQMVSKYNSRSVRFQVYVKEGKAAIKASPTKD